MDKMNVFRNEISDKLEEIKTLCKRERIPFFTCFAISDEKETNYVADIATPAGMNVKMKNDKFPDFANVLNGFKTIPYTTIVEEMDKDINIKNNDAILIEVAKEEYNSPVIKIQEDDEYEDEDEDGISLIELD